MQSTFKKEAVKLEKLLLDKFYQKYPEEKIEDKKKDPLNKKIALVLGN